MKAHARINGVSTIAIPKLGCGLDQIHWQVVVKLFRDIFANTDVQIVVYTLAENRVNAMFFEIDTEVYAVDKIERYSGEFYLENS